MAPNDSPRLERGIAVAAYAQEPTHPDEGRIIRPWWLAAGIPAILARQESEPAQPGREAGNANLATRSGSVNAVMRTMRPPVTVSTPTPNAR